MTEAADSAQQDPFTTRMAQLVVLLARLLVDAPDEISVEAIPAGDGILLRLTSAAADVAKVVGRQGRTARSLRTVLAAVSAKTSRRYTLDIVDLE